MADKKISQLPAATLPLAGTELLPIVQSGTTDNITVSNLAVGNVKSNATTGVLQVTGPTAASTRVMTTPDANFTVARTDAAQTFTGAQTWNDGGVIGDGKNIDMNLGVTASSKLGRADRAYMEVNRNDFDGNLFFYTTTSGSGGLTKRLDIAHTGDVTVNTGNLVIGTSGKGIDFSATPGTGTSELLADYEEGTWTPAASAGTSGTITLATPTDSMRYTKIGRIVTVCGFISVSSVSSPVGDFTITGLPYNIGMYTSGSCFVYGFANTAATTAMQVFGASGASAITIRGFKDGTQVTGWAQNVVANAGMYIQLTYMV